MKFEEYLSYFESILADPTKFELYQDEEYLNYTKLNWSRMSRWLKKFEATEEVTSFSQKITTKQQWILITEPWCGDAAHSVPVIFQLVKNNPNITLDVQLRDAEPSLIDQYLTNGGKSIPKLIVRDTDGNDIAVWGPRPEACNDLFLTMKAEGAESEEIKEAIQKWYNQDKGLSIQAELVKALS